MTSIRRICSLKHGSAVALSAAILVTAGEVRAQQATALDRFDPAAGPESFFAVPSAEVRGALRPFGGATFSYADAPLVATGGDDGVREVVSHQASLHLDAGIELWQRLLVDVSVATLLAQAGEASEVAAPPDASTTIGDVRLGARLALLRRSGWRPAAAMALDVWLPAGDDNAYAGAGVVRAAPRLVVGVDHAAAAWSVTAASRLLPTAPGGLSSSEVEVGAAGGPRFGPLWIGPETVLRVSIDAPAAAGRQISGEVRLGAKLALGPIQAGLAAGPGLGDGYGTPSFRVIGSLGIAADAPDRDSASTMDGPGAGTRDDRAAAPTGSPPAPGAAIACGPGLARVGSRCQADRDGDTIADALDACPAIAGVASLDAATNGCAAVVDADRDGVADARDACPSESGPVTADPKTTGCPTAVRFDGTQIVILQQVTFEVGKVDLERSSDVVLAEVTRVLAEHQDIARLAVDGHTDGQGDARANLLLSQRRALAVVSWLVEHGVDARRLEARGFGARRPLVDDSTPEGRARNRRVEFIVRKRTALGKAGWVDGPID